jgi:hypothetical protein
MMSGKESLVSFVRILPEVGEAGHAHFEIMDTFFLKVMAVLKGAPQDEPSNFESLLLDPAMSYFLAIAVPSVTKAVLSETRRLTVITPAYSFLQDVLCLGAMLVTAYNELLINMGQRIDEHIVPVLESCSLILGAREPSQEPSRNDASRIVRALRGAALFFRLHTSVADSVRGVLAAYLDAGTGEPVAHVSAQRQWTQAYPLLVETLNVFGRLDAGRRMLAAIYGARMTLSPSIAAPVAPAPPRLTEKLFYAILHCAATFACWLPQPRAQVALDELEVGVAAFYVECAPEDLKALSLDGLQRALSLLQLDPTAPAFARKQNSLVNLRLRFIARLLRSPWQDRKIKALVALNQLIDGVLSGDGTLGVTGPALASFCVREGLAELVASPRVHYELLRRCGPVLSLLCMHDLLSGEMLAGLVSLCNAGSAHQIVAHCVLERLLSLTTQLNWTQLHALFKLLSPTVNLDGDYNKDAVLLLSEVTFCGLQLTPPAHAPEEWLGLPLLWSLLHARAALAEAQFATGPLPSKGGGPGVQEAQGTCLRVSSVADEAVSSLQHVMGAFVRQMSSTRGVTQRWHYMRLCVEHVSQNHLSSTYEGVLLKLVQLFPENSKWFERHETQAKVLEQLDKKFNLLEHTLNDVKYYKTIVSSCLDSGSNSSLRDKKEAIAAVPASPAEARSLIPANFLKEISLRQEFLFFLLKNSALALTVGQLNLIWTMLVERAVLREESDFTMRFLLAALKDKSPYQVLSVDCRSRLFRLCGFLHTGSLSLDAVSLIEYCFLAQNQLVRIVCCLLSLSVHFLSNNCLHFWQANALDVSATAAGDFILASVRVKEHSRLQGLSALWYVLRGTVNAGAATRVTALLTALYTQLDIPNAGATQTNYLRQLLSLLSQSLAAPTPSESGNVASPILAKRALALLRGFLQAFDSVAKPVRTSGGLQTLSLVPDREFASREVLLRVGDPRRPVVTVGALQREAWRVLKCNDAGLTQAQLSLSVIVGGQSLALSSLDHNALLHVLPLTDGARVRVARLKVALAFEVPSTLQSVRHELSDPFASNPLGYLSASDRKVWPVFSVVAGERVAALHATLPPGSRFS